MSDPIGSVIKSETRISVLINMALSAAFFLSVFGTSPRLLTLAAPDNLALDFVFQSVAIGFFATMVPALLVNKKRRQGLIVGLDVYASPVKTVFGRAVVAAVICGLFGSMAAFLLPMGTKMIAYYPAFSSKVIFGGLLALLVTPRALRLVLLSK